MKKNILLIIVSLSALFLLQCQYAKDILKELNDLGSKESESVSSSSWKPQSSSSEALKKRKEAN